jgi:hypothetical protein
MVIFFRSRSRFAAERDGPELILAIYVVSVSSDPRSKGHFSAFESAPWIPSAAEPACGAKKSQLRQPPRSGRKKMRKRVQFGCSLCIIFASLLHACLALYSMLSR